MTIIELTKEVELLKQRNEQLEATNKALALIVNDHEGKPKTLRELLTATQANYARHEQLVDLAEKYGDIASDTCKHVGNGFISHSCAVQICKAHGVDLDKEVD